MAKVEFTRVETDEDLENVSIKDGRFIVTGEGKAFVDYGENRIPIGGTPDTEMSDTSENAVQNKVIKEYVDDQIDSIPKEITNEYSTSTDLGYSANYVNDNYTKKINYITDIDLKTIFDEYPTSNSTTTYTFFDDGYLYLFATRGSNSGFTLQVSIDNVQRYIFPAYDAYAVVTILIPVKKNQVLKISTDNTNNTWCIRVLKFLQ